MKQLVDVMISTFNLQSIAPLNPTNGLELRDDKSAIVMTGSSSLK